MQNSKQLLKIKKLLELV